MNYSVAHDMLFSHAPTQAWAIYKGVQSDDVSLGEFIESIPYGTCWEGQNGISMADGTISATGGLCSTDLFFNGADQEGTNVCGGTDYTVGPHWNVGLNGTCPFNGPGSNASLGPTGLNPAAESNAIGFSKALGFNFNTNAMRVFVRRAICGNGVVEGNEECDNGLNGTPLCTAECIIP